MASGASFPTTVRQVRCTPLLIPQRMLTFAEPCDHPRKAGHCKVLPPLKFCLVMPVSSETPSGKAAVTPSATAMSLLPSMPQHLISPSWSCVLFEHSPLSATSSCFSKVFFQLILPTSERWGHTRRLQPWLPKVVISHQKEMVLIPKDGSFKMLA